MPLHQRRLPHLYELNHPIFLTWRLHGSLPPNRHFCADALTSGEAFATMDSLLDEVRTGPFYLRQPPIAEMMVEVIQHHANVFNRYALHAFVVMPNHVHLLISPRIPLPKLTRTLKSFSAKRANEMLELVGTPFWQQESYDRMVRDGKEFDRIQRYIEQNPVRAGIVADPTKYRWSSAAGATGGSLHHR